VVLPADLPVVDHHCHLSPTGEGVGAARRFRAAGGTHLFLATQNYAAGVPLDLDAYRRQFETTVELARAVEQSAEVRTYVVLAPYPVDLLRQVEALGTPAAVDLQRAAMALAGRFVEEDRAVALGEVGRPHFPVDESLAGPVEEVVRSAFEVGRDVGCPLVVHAEELDGAGFQGLAQVAAQTLFPVHRLVKHYHRAVLPVPEYHGAVPSYLAKRETVAAALPTSGPWFLETDYLDDPARPGAVLDLPTVPRRAVALAAAGSEAVERLRIPFERSIQSVYGFTPEVDDRGRPR
jgi:TatD-related deoxyribonuclease